MLLKSIFGKHRFINFTYLKMKNNKSIQQRKNYQNEIINKLKNEQLYKTFTVEQPYKYIIEVYQKKQYNGSPDFYKLYQRYTDLNKQILLKDIKMSVEKFGCNMFNHFVRYDIAGIEKNRIKNINELTDGEYKKIRNFVKDIIFIINSKFAYMKNNKTRLGFDQSQNIYYTIKNLKIYVYLIRDQDVDILTQLIQIYFLIMHYSGHNIFKSDSNTISIILEKIIYQNRVLNQSQINKLVQFCSRFSVFNMSSNLENQFWVYIIKNLPTNWIEDEQNYSLIFSFAKQGLLTEGLKNDFEKCLQKCKKIRLKNKALLLEGCLKTSILTKENLQTKYSFIIDILMQQRSTQNLKQVIKYFLFDENWNIRIWTRFFEILKAAKIQQKQFYNIAMILSTINLCRQQIPKIIYDKLLEVKQLNPQLKEIQKLSSKYFQEQYQQKFVKNAKTQKNFYQINLQSQLKSLKIDFQYEITINLFKVDLFIPQYNLIIEVNGLNHYIRYLDKNITYMTIKSQFKKRMLQKLGYKMINIQLFNLQLQPSQLILKIINEYPKLT